MKDSSYEFEVVSSLNFIPSQVYIWRLCSLFFQKNNRIESRILWLFTFQCLILWIKYQNFHFLKQKSMMWKSTWLFYNSRRNTFWSLFCLQNVYSIKQMIEFNSFNDYFPRIGSKLASTFIRPINLILFMNFINFKWIILILVHMKIIFTFYSI